MIKPVDPIAGVDVLRLSFLNGEPDEALWADLAERALDPNPFFRPGFLKPYLAHMGPRAVGLIVVRDRESGDWLAAAPVGRRRVGVLFSAETLWAHDFGPLGTPLIDPRADRAAIETFLAAAAGRSNFIVFPFLPVASKTAGLLTNVPGWSARWVHTIERACLDAGPAGQEHPDQTIRSRKRKELRRLLRRLEESGPVEMRSLEGEGALQGFDDFLELEARGWKGRAGSALAARNQTADFAQAAVRASANQRGLRIDELRAGPDLIASLVSFVERGRVFAWKIAYDEQFSRYSPGAQIAVYARDRNILLPDFVQADSLAIPGHSMIEPLWTGRLPIGTLLMSRGCGTFRSDLAAADLALERWLRARGRVLRQRLQGRKTRQQSSAQSPDPSSARA